jgi:hypothetical protein
MKIPVHLSKSEMPQSGYSETFSVEAISKVNLLKLVRANQSGRLTI